MREREKERENRICRKSAQIGRKAGKFDQRANFTARHRMRAASTIHFSRTDNYSDLFAVNGYR